MGEDKNMAVGSLIALQTLSVGAQIFSGIEAQKAADAEASLQRQQGEILSLEANEEAARIERNAASLRKRQKILFLKSGVSLEGSPLLILEETQREAQKEADAVRKRGVSQFTLGRQRAKAASRRGRSALISATGKAVASTVSFAIAGTELGLFETKATSNTRKV